MADSLRGNDYLVLAHQQMSDAFVKDRGDPAIMKAILGTKPEYLQATFDEMRRSYGTIENYFSQALGIDAAGQQALGALPFPRR